MEVAALYDLKLSPNTLLSFYAAPIGDPAIGPTAYPPRHPPHTLRNKGEGILTSGPQWRCSVAARTPSAVLEVANSCAQSTASKRYCRLQNSQLTSTDP